MIPIRSIVNGIFLTSSRKRSLSEHRPLLTITKLILQYSYPEIGFKQAQGIVHLTRLYEKSRIETACQRMLSAQHCSYRSIENMLKSGMDKLDLFNEEKNHIPPHHSMQAKLFSFFNSGVIVHIYFDLC